MSEEVMVNVPEELADFVQESPAEAAPAEQSKETPADPPAQVEPSAETEKPTEDKIPESIPYTRFKEAIDQKNLWKAKAEAAEQARTIPAQPAPNPVNISEQISKVSEQVVKARLGLKDLDADDFNLLAVTDPAKFTRYVKELAKEEIARENDYRDFVKSYPVNVDFLQKHNTPDAAVLISFAKEELATRPNREAVRIDQALSRIGAYRGTAEDIAIGEKFIAECREKMTKGAEPPEKESLLDKAAALPAANKLGGTKSGAMTWAQVEELIKNHDIDKIPVDMLAQIDKRLIE